MIVASRKKVSRSAVAATEFAVCLPFMFLVLAGCWEVGRMTEIQGVTYNACREAARDASLCVDNLATVTSNAVVYLQAAEPQAFGYGHATSTATASGLPSGTYGMTVTDTVNNQELFTLTYADIMQWQGGTSWSAYGGSGPDDPTLSSKLDVYQLGIQVPYRSIAISPIQQITGVTRLNATVTWMCMRDTPFSPGGVLPGQ